MRRLGLALIAIVMFHAHRVEAQGAPPSASWLPALSVTVRPGAMQAPDSVASGWTRFHLVKESGRHVVVVFRLRDGADPSAFLAAFDTARMTPSTGVAVGGSEVMGAAEVAMNLAPGRYVVACMVRDTPAMKRHLVLGESKVFVVAPKRSAAKPPRAGAEVHMFDFAYRAPDLWKRGAQWVRVSNEGTDDHLMLVARLHDGVSLSQWARAKETDTVATPLTGVSRTSPGGVVYLPLSLTPGHYVIYCRIINGKSGMAHEKMGMIKEITVE